MEAAKMGCKRTSLGMKHDLGINLHDLDETGRLHYFYHSPSSVLPIRDVLNELGHDYKTEPYLEKQAENYCCECMQPNIRGFLRSREKYLFLVTKCMRREIKYFGAHYIVGYLQKSKTQGYEWRPGGFCAVRGDMRIYSFQDAYRLESMANFRWSRRKKDERETGRILDHLADGRNILNNCLIELERLKRNLPKEERRKQAKKCR
jgi:hypothetical protein